MIITVYLLRLRSRVIVTIMLGEMKEKGSCTLSLMMRGLARNQEWYGVAGQHQRDKELSEMREMTPRIITSTCERTRAPGQIN